MNDQEALLASIRACPEDDAPRLVYADWLDESGDDANAARAAFIRTQIERGRLPTQKTKWHNLARRESQLLNKHGAAWVRPIGGHVDRGEHLIWGFANRHKICPERPDQDFGSYRWGRGFITRVEAPPEAFTAEAPKLFAHEPVTEVAVTTPDAPAAWNMLGALTIWSRVRRLDLRGNGAYAIVAGLLGQREFTNLQSLEVASDGSLFWLNDIAGHTHLNDLAELNIVCFGEIDVQDDAQNVDRFARTPLAARLEQLSFMRWGPWSSALDALFTPPSCGRLVSLELSEFEGAYLTPDILARILQIPTLKRLTLRASFDGDTFASALDRVERSSPLESLSIRSYPPMDLAIERLFRHPIRLGLRSLDLPRLETIDVGMLPRLIEAFPPGQLEYLHFSNSVTEWTRKLLRAHFGKGVVQ